MMHKKLFAISLVVVLGAALLFCWGESVDKNETAGTEAGLANFQKVKLDIAGMTCSGCAFGVETALKNVAGVKQAGVRFDEKSAEVEFDPMVARVPNLVEAVENAGFKAKPAGLNSGEAK